MKIPSLPDQIPIIDEMRIALTQAGIKARNNGRDLCRDEKVGCDIRYLSGCRLMALCRQDNRLLPVKGKSTTTTRPTPVISPRLREL